MNFNGLLIALTLISASAADQQCTDAAGSCQIWPTLTCTGGWENGSLCNGGGNRRCCFVCDSDCLANEALYIESDGECRSRGGSCKDSSNYCNGKYTGGLCGGQDTRQCCDVKSSPTESCPLITFKATDNVKGFNEVFIRIHRDFLPAMNITEQAAQDCGVENPIRFEGAGPKSLKIFIIHSFRKRQPAQGQTSSNAPRRSNYLAGHAFAMYAIQTENTLCNGRCIQGRENADANCFIDLIKEAGLRWGGDFIPSDPTHIDDGFGNNSARWKALVEELQFLC